MESNKVELSLELFSGPDKKKRMSCAEALYRAFYEDFTEFSEKDIQHLKKCAFGKAPGKVCGAYYAGIYLLESKYPQFIEEYKQLFEEKAGSLICKDIRKAKRLSCQACVELSAQILNQISEMKKEESASTIK